MHRLFAVIAPLCCLGLLAVGLVGCTQDPLGRQAISGAVVVDGSPLIAGDINFEPIEGQPTAGGAVIESGRYEVPRAGGLVAGKYRVSIHAPVPGTGGEPDENALPGDPPKAPREMIPKEWNTASNATIQVTKQGKNVFDFDVSTKGAAKSTR